MSGLEVVAFILALDPILTRGQSLIERYKTFKSNKKNATEAESFITFQTELCKATSELERKARGLPQTYRQLLDTDVQTLLALLRKAAEHATKSHKYSANPTKQFFRANTLSGELSSLSETLKEAREKLQDARKFTEIMQAIERNSPTHEKKEQFLRHYPKLTDNPFVALDFDAVSENGDPATVEGHIKKLLVMGQLRTPRVVVIYGEGGVGKSTILAGLAGDTDVRKTFPDGVHFMRLGITATQATLMRAIRKILRDSGAVEILEGLNTSENLDEAIDAAVSWFDGKRCGFFVDDVWSRKIGVGLLGRLCRLADETGERIVIMTSREDEVAAITHDDSAVSIKRRDRHGSDSREILFFHGDKENKEWDNEIEANVHQVLSVCDGLPVLLAAAGKAVKKMQRSMGCQEQVVWRRYASKLNQCRESLIVEPVAGYGSLVATLTASIAVLEEDKDKIDYGTSLTFAEMYRRLCVLEKQARVPLSMLKHLWEVENETNTEMIAMEYAEMGLGHVEGQEAKGEWVWRMSIHDSLHDFAVVNARKFGDLKSIHEGLVRMYRQSDAGLSDENGGPRWWSEELSPDGYVHENLCRHLYEAGLKEELVELGLSPEWARRRLEVNDVLSLEGDLSLCLKAIKNVAIAGKQHKEEGLKTILAAVRLSSDFIAKNEQELWFQLHARMRVEAERKPEVKRYLNRAMGCARTPRLESLNSFLVGCGGSTTRILRISGRPICFTAMDEKRFACGCFDGTVVILDWREGVVTKKWCAHENMPLKYITTWKNLLVTVAIDGTAKLWNAETGACIQTFTDHLGAVKSVAFTADGCLVMGCLDGRAVVWDTDGQFLKDQYETGGPVLSVSSLPDGRIVSASSDNVVRIWDSTGEAVELIGHEDLVSCLSTSCDGHIISGSLDGTVRIWNPTSFEQTAELRHTSSVYMIVTRDRLIAFTDYEGKISTWESSGAANELDSNYGRGKKSGNQSIVIVEDSVVSRAADGTFRFLNINSTAGHEPDRHSAEISCIRFLPDGRAVTGSMDGTVRIWNQMGQTLETFTEHNSRVTGVAVCTGGKIASVSHDGTLLIWSVETFEVMHTLVRPEEYFVDVASLDDGSVIIGLMRNRLRDGALRLWNFDNEKNIEVSTDLQVSTEEMIMGVSRRGDRVIVVSVPIEWDCEITEVIPPEILALQVTSRMFRTYRRKKQKLALSASCRVEGSELSLQCLCRKDCLCGNELIKMADEIREYNDATALIRGVTRDDITIDGKEIHLGGIVLGTMEYVIRDWDFWGDVIGLGLANGGVAFVRICSPG